LRRRPVELLSARRCPACGAWKERGRAACVKCGARARWARRKARHDGLDE
jgi:uncharacterized OB-fold protein